MTVTSVDGFNVQNGRQIGPGPPEELPPGAPPQLPGGARTHCAECGAAFPESEMIPFAGSWICAKCKPIFLQRVREGAPLAGIGAEAWQSGDAVVTLHGGALPARCAKCNGAVTGPPIVRTFYWQPQWLLALLLIPLLALIVWFLVRKPVVVLVPICEECRRRRQAFIGVGWLLVIIATAVLIAAISMESGVVVILAFVIAIVATLIGLWRGMLIYLRTIDAQHIWMRGFCREYVASLPEFRKGRWP